MSVQQPLKESPQLISYRTLRKAIGWLGVTLPAAMLMGNRLFGRCVVLQDSVSHYYYTITGSLLVGILCAVGLFLLTYKGYPHSIDNLITGIAGVMAIGIALFPTNNNSMDSCAIIDWPDSDIRRIIHYTCAAVFFLLLSYISLFLFTKSKGGKTKEKKLRNKIYRTCGVIILIAIGLIAIYGRFEKQLENLQPYKPVFWLEWLALLAFGMSWLVKGELVLKDKEPWVR